MSLTDAGALYALVDKRQEAYARCKETLARLPKPVLTTWPCFAEAMYFAYRSGGWPMQKLLWGFVQHDALHFYDLTEGDITRMQALMERYRDTPMDLADASLVAAAEALSLRRIFTLDSDFYVYRTADGQAFEVVP
jgi:predicted nucleic acid-binding protein